MSNDNQRTFVSQLPNRPYCADEMGYTKIRNKEKALKMLYLQANQPAIQTCLLFDIDEQNSFFKFEEANLPIPQFITKSVKHSKQDKHRSDTLQQLNQR